MPKEVGNLVSRGYGMWKDRVTLPDSFFFDPLPDEELTLWTEDAWQESGIGKKGNRMREIETNKAILRNFIQSVWIEGHLDRLGEFWTEDCVNHAAPASMNKGLEALASYHQQVGSVFASFSDIRINIVQQIAEADRVVTQILTTAKHTGNFMGVAGSGKPVSLATIRIDRLRDGKIAEHWSVADMAGLMQQLKS